MPEVAVSIPYVFRVRTVVEIAEPFDPDDSKQRSKLIKLAVDKACLSYEYDSWGHDAMICAYYSDLETSDQFRDDETIPIQMEALDDTQEPA